MIAALARWLERRIGGSSFAREQLGKVFPESWTFLFGEVALDSFVVLVATGTFLALFFDPSLAEVTYRGSYEPLQGLTMSKAYESAVRLSFDVRAGLLLRQAHHWAALVFVAAIVLHLMRIFFTGAFRKPRDLNWMIGVTMLLLAMLEGFAGYSLLDDLLSGVGLAIGHAIVESIPVVGTHLASMVFGGPFPGEEIIGRLFVAHVYLIPAALAGLIGLHLSLIVRNVHTQFPGHGRTEKNVVGLRLWPSYAAKSVGLMLLTAAVLVALGGLVQINPVWLYGPYDPFLVTIGAQPDWYVGWLEGALRLFPPWEVTIGGYMVPNQFFPTILLPALTALGLYLYPATERWLTGDRLEHHLLDRPRDRPGRTAFGVGVVTFYAVLLTAGSQDLIAYTLQVPITSTVWVLRTALIVLPLVTGALAHRICRDLQQGKLPTGAEQFAELDEEDEEPDEAAPAYRRWQVPLLALLPGPLARRSPRRR
jgi:ubiquinol-cytochrome c reductase cytochrome b subunit